MTRALPCLLIGLAAALVGPGASAEGTPSAPRAPVRIDFGAKRPAHLYAPVDPKPSAPLVVMLHGMCALPEYECPLFRQGTGQSWLLCPPGPIACSGGGGAMWTGDTERLVRAIERARAAAIEQEPARIDTSRQILVGYSMGAFAALRVAVKSKQFKALMILNASVTPRAAELKRAGVVRVALVSGDRDRSGGKLKRAARQLEKAGIAARYFALANTGHYFDAAGEALLVPPLTWLQNE